MNINLPTHHETLQLFEKDKGLSHAKTPPIISERETQTPNPPKIAKKNIQKEKKVKNKKIITTETKVGEKHEGGDEHGLINESKDCNNKSEKVKVINISYPYELPPECKTNKRFSLYVDYIRVSDPQTVIRKKINFGEKGVPEMIDKEAMFINPLSPHFYRTFLLGKCTDLKEAYVNLIQKIL